MQISEHEINGAIKQINSEIELQLIRLQEQHKGLSFFGRKKTLSIEDEMWTMGRINKAINDGILRILYPKNLHWYRIYNGDQVAIRGLLTTTFESIPHPFVVFGGKSASFNSALISSMEITGNEFMIDVYVK